MDSLGRGLSSLIPEKQPDEVPPDLDPRGHNSGAARFSGGDSLEPDASRPAVSASVGVPRTYEDHFSHRRNDSVFLIDVEKVDPNPFQPRREFNEEALAGLAHSIREHGVLQPVLVAKREIETPAGLEVRYQLIAGERRCRAAKLAGLSQIPAVIRKGIPDDRIRLELALIENVQREDLNAMERAHAFKKLIDEFHLVQREISHRIGRSREFVANTIRLHGLIPEIQEALLQNKISEGHARAILMAGNQAAQMQAYQAITADNMNVREAENRARQIAGRTFTPRKRPAADPELREWQQRLQEKFGAKVMLQRMGSRGKIVVEFYSEEELHGILNKLIQQA